MFAFLLCILLVLMLWKYSKRLPASFPPGPRSPLPVVGDAYILKGNLSKGFGKLHHKYGDTFGLFLGRTKTVVTRDFELAKEILAKEEFSARPLARSVRAFRGALDNPGYQGLPGIVFSSMANWQVKCVSSSDERL